jgi:hypothetical protein
MPTRKREAGRIERSNPAVGSWQGMFSCHSIAAASVAVFESCGVAKCEECLAEICDASSGVVERFAMRGGGDPRRFGSRVVRVLVVSAGVATPVREVSSARSPVPRVKLKAHCTNTGISGFLLVRNSHGVWLVTFW